MSLAMKGRSSLAIDATRTSTRLVRSCNGEISDINISDFDESLENIQDMCDSIDANISSIQKINSNTSDRYYYKICINDNIK